MSVKYLKEELSECLGVSYDDIDNLFSGCSYLGEVFEGDEYEDDDFIIKFSFKEVDEDIVLDYANTHPNPNYVLYDDEDLMILENGYIESKVTGNKAEYALNIHRCVDKVDGLWKFNGNIFIEYWNVKSL